MSFYYRANFIVRFDSNYDFRFDYNKLYFDNEMIIHNRFNLNNKIFDRFNYIEFDLIS